MIKTSNNDVTSADSEWDRSKNANFGLAPDMGSKWTNKTTNNVFVVALVDTCVKPQANT